MEAGFRHEKRQIQGTAIRDTELRVMKCLGKVYNRSQVGNRLCPKQSRTKISAPWGLKAEGDQNQEQSVLNCKTQ